MQNAGMIYGYARVSTVAQDLASQLAQLWAAGCEKVFREKITGATADRPQLKKLMAALAHGDIVIIPAVDRLSRDTTDLMVIARDMQRAGAGLRSLAEPVLDTTGDFAELVLAMLGVAAKLERRRIAERTARGRAGALQGQVHEHAVLRDGASIADVVVGGMGQEDRGHIGRDREVRPDPILVLGLQVARIARDGEIGPATDRVDGVDRFVQPPRASRWRSPRRDGRPPRSRRCRSASG